MMIAMVVVVVVVVVAAVFLVAKRQLLRHVLHRAAPRPHLLNRVVEVA